MIKSQSNLSLVILSHNNKYRANSELGELTALRVPKCT